MHKIATNAVDSKKLSQQDCRFYYRRPPPQHIAVAVYNDRPVCVLRARNIACTIYTCSIPTRRVSGKRAPLTLKSWVYYIRTAKSQLQKIHKPFEQGKNMARSWKKLHSFSIFLEGRDIQGKERGEVTTLLQATSFWHAQFSPPWTWRRL